jgi:hypothetical protein
MVRMFYGKRLDKLDTQLASLKEQISELHRAVRNTPEPKRSDPLIYVVAIGYNLENRIVSLGTCERLKNRYANIGIVSHVNLQLGHVVVMCDLERVYVKSILMGIDCLHTSYGTCPIAFFRTWPIGTRLTILCEKELEQ